MVPLRRAPCSTHASEQLVLVPSSRGSRSQRARGTATRYQQSDGSFGRSAEGCTRYTGVGPGTVGALCYAGERAPHQMHAPVVRGPMRAFSCAGQ